MTPDTPAAAAPPDEIAEYRELSGTAIVSLVLGLLSPVSSLALTLIAVPLVAIAVGFAALRAIAADPAGRSGREIALTGIGLAVACLAMGIVQTPLTQRLLTHQAAPTGIAWLESIRADDLGRATAITSPAQSVPGEPAPSLSERFPAVAKLLELENWVGERLLSAAAAQRTRGAWRVTLTYQILLADQKPQEVELSLLRRPASGPNLARWYVIGGTPLRASR